MPIQTDDASTVAEVRRLWLERDRHAKAQAEIDRRIAELVGISPQQEVRKKKAMSRDFFKSACGVRSGA